MGEENQNTTVSLRDKTRQFLDFQMNARKQQAQDFWLKRAKQQQDLYTSWLNSTNPEISKQCTKAVRVGQIAEWIRDYFSKPENWWEDYSNIEDVPLVDNYISLNPDRKAQLYDYVLEDNQICDPTQLYTDMGWIQEQEEESSTLSNIVWWAYDSATWIPRMIAKGTANAIGWVAKQFWADDDKVNSLVNDYKNYLDSDWSGETIWADKDSWTYKGTKMVWDLAQTAAYGWLAKAWVQSALWGYPLVTKATPLWVKAAVWAIEWAWDMAIYDMVSESELPSAWDLVLWGTLWAITPIAWAWYKAVKAATKKNAVNLAEKILQNANRMTKWEQSKFYQRYNQNVWQWLNDRGLRNWEDIVNYFTNSKNKVDEAMASIKWEFTDDSLTNVLDDVVDFAIGTKSPQANRMIELAEKNRKGWLTMSEINEVKRYFEAHNKFNYLSKWTAEQAERATNMDTSLREWQRKIAEENWFSNLAELNRETAAAKEILNWSTKWEAWVKGNNPISITDWIAVMWWWLSPESVATLALKKWWDTPAVKSKVVDMLNWIWGHETMTEKLADLEKIMEINKIKDQKALEKYVDDLYKEWWVWDTTPRLPESVEWWVAAWDRGFVTQNPSSPTFEQLWLQETRGINEINAAWQQGTKMYDIANQKYRWIADDIIANWGATLDAATMSKVWWDYYALSLFPNRNRQIPKAEFKDQHVLDYVEDNLDRLLEPWNSLWAWVSPTDMVHLDVSTTLPKKYLKQAKSLAKKYNQEAIYDLWTFEEIPTWWTWEPMDIDEEEVVKILKSLLSKKK